VLRRFSPGLDELEHEVLAQPQSPLEDFTSLDLAVAGDRLLAVWTKARAHPGAESELEVFGWLDGNRAPFPIVASPGRAFAPSVTVTGHQFRVTMTTRGAAAIVSCVVDPMTGAPGPMTTISSRRLPQPAVLSSARLGGSVVVAFDVFEHGATTIDAALVSPTGARPLLLVPAAPSQRQLALTRSQTASSRPGRTRGTSRRTPTMSSPRASTLKGRSRR